MIALSTPLRLKRVAPGQGAQWVRAGFRVFFQRPLAFTGLFAAFLFVSMLLSLLLPLVGSVLALMLMPLLTLGFMQATEAVLQGRQPGLALFIEPLRGDPKRRNVLIQLGVAYGLAMLAAFAFSGWLGGEASDAARVALEGGKASPESVDAILGSRQWLGGMGVLLGIAALLAIPFWHAPALAYWGGQGFAQALFSSTLACWRARGAFLVFSLAWLAVIGLFGLFISLVFTVLGSRELIGVATLPAGLMFSTVFYASLYFTFADSFASEPPAPAALPDGT